MKIKKIKKLNNNKYRLEFERGEKLTTYDEVILKYQLLFNKDVDAELYSNILKDTEVYENYNKSLKRISVKLRSKYEIKKYLEKLDLNLDEQTRIIKELEEKGFLDDERYAKAYISDHVHLSNEGPYRIKKDLLEHEISELLIDNLLEQYSDDVFIDNLINRMKKRSNQNKSSVSLLKQKLKAEFLNLGYTNEQINKALDSLQFNSSNIEKEALKIRNRLSKKYDGAMLDLQVKNRLYQKGYSSDEINRLKQ